jgi:pimeloyl-ACP methyl ester carboxylesterase
MSRTILALGFLLAVLCAAVGDPVLAQAPPVKRVEIQTFDGVTLGGTFYPSNGGKKDSVVLMLHDFDMKGGGSSHQDGWDKLAERLQKEGYDVLSFDFRGFGDSTKVNPALFWAPMNRHNVDNVKRRLTAGKPSSTISYKDFNSHYYRYLVNDIAAAKTFLDERNDAMELNSGNLIVVGAGQGATLGAMFLASECRRCRVTGGLGVPPMVDEPESRFIAAGVWLSLSPKLGNGDIGSTVKNWTRIAAAEKQIPMAFIYAKNDSTGENFAKACKQNITQFAKGAKLDYTGEHAIADSAATGSKLLAPRLDTENWIVKSYIEPCIKDRRIQPRKDKKLAENRYDYVIPGAGRRMLAKPQKAEILSVDVGLFLGR